jgi:hypothetical protein
VATVTDAAVKGDIVTVLSDEGKKLAPITVTTDVPLPLHKIALTPIAKEGEVRKYGETIGYASTTIDRGAWIHTHNIQSANLPEKQID